MRRLPVLLLGILMLVVSACRIDTTVEIVVDEDGSGTVAVTVIADAAAAAMIPDDPDQLRFEDLEAGGWSIDGPESTVTGGVSFTATKGFANREALPGVLAEIAGDDVFLVDVELDKAYEFDWLGLGPATTDYLLTGTIDPTPAIESFVDERLPPSLGLAERLAEQLAAETDFNLTVQVRLPESESSSSGEVAGESVVWEVAYGDDPVDIDASSSSEDILPRVWAVVALVALVLLGAILLVRLASYGLAVLRTPKGRRRRDVRRRQHRAATRAEEANRPRSRMLRLLVVDVHGVLVRPTDPLEGLLLPLITAERPDIDAGTVRDLHRRLVLGRLSVEEFWGDVGLGPVAEEIETRYLSSFRLVPGLHPFLDRMKASQLPVAAVGNQPRPWGDRLRRMADLDDAVASWMVSGDVGSTLPEPALFEATRRMLAVDLFDCFYLSNVPDHLDAAKEMGMATGLFVAGEENAPETDHSVVRGFEELLRSRSS